MTPRHPQPTHPGNHGLDRLVDTWATLDVHEPRAPLLLALGTELHPGRSARRALGREWTSTTLPRLHEALATGNDLAAPVGTGSLRIRVVLTHSPVTRTVVAARVVVEDADRPAGPPPGIGAWEWVITPPHGDAPGTRTSHWSPEVAALYGHPPGDVHTIPAPDWQNRMVDPIDRARIYSYVEQAIEHVDDDLYVLGYSIRTTHGPESMRMVGRGIVDAEGSTTGFVGFSHRVHGDVVERTGTLFPPAATAYAAALMGLYDDSVVALVNPVDERAYDQSGPRRWNDLGLDPTVGQDVLAALHPDDVEPFRDFAHRVIDDRRHGIRTVRLRARSSGWMRFRLVGRRLGVGDAFHALIRLHHVEQLG